MNFLRPLFPLLLCAALVGCGSSIPTQTAQDLPPKEPLTVEAWKALPVAEKYDTYSFERLKLNDPKLNDEKAWKQFMIKVVVPERKKDIPSK